MRCRVGSVEPRCVTPRTAGTHSALPAGLLAGGRGGAVDRLAAPHGMAALPVAGSEATLTSEIEIASSVRARKSSMFLRLMGFRARGARLS